MSRDQPLQAMRLDIDVTRARRGWRTELYNNLLSWKSIIYLKNKNVDLSARDVGDIWRRGQDRSKQDWSRFLRLHRWHFVCCLLQHAVEPGMTHCARVVHRLRAYPTIQQHMHRWSWSNFVNFGEATATCLYVYEYARTVIESRGGSCLCIGWYSCILLPLGSRIICRIRLNQRGLLVCNCLHAFACSV